MTDASDEGAQDHHHHPTRKSRPTICAQQAARVGEDRPTGLAVPPDRLRIVEGEALATPWSTTCACAGAATKAPAWHAVRNVFEDTPPLTGGQVVTEKGFKARQSRHRHAGLATRVVVDKENTTIVGG